MSGCRVRTYKRFELRGKERKVDSYNRLLLETKLRVIYITSLRIQLEGNEGGHRNCSPWILRLSSLSSLLKATNVSSIVFITSGRKISFAPRGEYEGGFSAGHQFVERF